MGLARLFPALALLAGLVVPASASAADARVQALSIFEFAPREQKIAVGDTVTWEFEDDGHTSASVGGQAERWNSGPDGTNLGGTTFTHTFDTPGRFQYVCTPHKAFMKGVVEVGTDAVRKTVANYKSNRTGSRVRISFKLNEPAKMTYRVTGPTRKTVARRRLAKGKRSFAVRGLARGSYRSTLTLVDDFDKKTSLRRSFVVR